MRLLQSIISIISKYLPFWILFFSLIGFVAPHLFEPIQGLTGPALGLIFLLMGMSLSTESIVSVLKAPKFAFMGVTIKWAVSVVVSVVIAYLFFSNYPEIATGIILSGTVPSGTSANLYTFIANGEAALSITMAAMDTFIGPVLTPVLVQFFAGQFIPIAFWPLFINIVLIVFVPIVAGLLIQRFWPGQVAKVSPFTPVLSMLSLFVVVLAVVSSADASLKENMELLPKIFIAVFFQVSIPMIAGYWIARAFKFKERHCRAILFHTGICNTALAATLAMNHVSSVAAVPAVANMITNLTLGALVANLFSMKIDKKKIGREIA